jgi:hypothetical protein
LYCCIQFVNSQELALVKKNGKIGYISKDGDFKIEPQYKSAKSFSEGLAAAEENGKWGFIDAKGAWVIPADFKDARKILTAGLLLFKKIRIGCISIQKEKFKKHRHTDKVFDFNNDVAFIRQGDKVGLINSKMTVVLEPKYDQIKSFENGYR